MGDIDENILTMFKINKTKNLINFIKEFSIMETVKYKKIRWTSSTKIFQSL